DIGLENLTSDDEYLSQLKTVIPSEIDKFQPDLVVYVAGADPYEKDQLGSLKLSKKGLKERDDLVIFSCVERRIPVLVVLAGGYAKDTQDTVELHFNTCVSAIDALKNIDEISHSFEN